MDDLSHLSPEMRRILAQVREELEDLYGPRLKAVYLYGSYARGDQREGESDIDVAVILDDFESSYGELDRMGDRIYPISLDSNVVISCRPIRVRDYDQGQEWLYLFVKDEGVPL